LADGGLFGRGLGQSRAKWSYLPNAHNDFIFAIIGEELGMIGCLAVIGLFGLFVYTGLRIAMRSVDPFLRLLTAGATCWVFGQAMINIGYVVGLLPVTGLQLPLVSYGGTSTAITLLMFGIIASAARHEPEAIAALHAGQEGRIARALRLPLPAVFSPKRAAMARSKSTRPTLAAQDRTRLESRKNKDGRGARSPEPGRTRVSSSRVDTAGPNGSARNAPRGHARRAEPQRRDTGSGYAAGPRSPYRPRPEPQPGRPPVRSGERGYRR
jgi:cell division protein FtsW